MRLNVICSTSILLFVLFMIKSCDGVPLVTVLLEPIVALVAVEEGPLAAIAFSDIAEVVVGRVLVERSIDALTETFMAEIAADFGNFAAGALWSLLVGYVCVSILIVFHQTSGQVPRTVHRWHLSQTAAYSLLYTKCRFIL
jgi:hypothetical protein